jgi:hypothetical protein
MHQARMSGLDAAAEREQTALVGNTFQVFVNSQFENDPMRQLLR